LLLLLYLGLGLGLARTQPRKAAILACGLTTLVIGFVIVKTGR
jgi:hypothetical protein